MWLVSTVSECIPNYPMIHEVWYTIIYKLSYHSIHHCNITIALVGSRMGVL